MNRPLVNELHCTYTFPLRGAVMATTRKIGTLAPCLDAHFPWHATATAVLTLVADGEGILELG